MSEPSFLSVAQSDRREECRCPERATKRSERDFLRLAPASAIAMRFRPNRYRGAKQWA
jgi:hypothetical protein